MSPEIRDLFSSGIRSNCFSRYNITAARLISDWHAFTFEAETSTGPCILKVAHSSHRTYDQLEAETDWLLYLVSKGVNVPGIHRSISSLCVEKVPAADSYFSVVSYEKLVGEPIGDAFWTDTLFRNWGSLIGRLHRLSSGYVPKRRRYIWHESDFLNLESYIPRTDVEIRTGAQRIIQAVKDVPLSELGVGEQRSGKPV